MKDFIIEKNELKRYEGNDENVVIPDTVRKIGMHSFSFKDLKSVIIPKSVTYIGSAFNWCTKLKHIYFEGNEAEWNIVANDCKLETYNHCFFYSENQPEVNGVLWRYVDGKPRTWACATCNGTGYTLVSNKLYTCSKCKGSGNDY